MQEEKEINSYLSFKVGKELFAVNVGKVIEILEWREVTKVPQSPEYMRGVINLRGNVLPVIDTRMKFGFETQPETINTCIIVLDIATENETIRIGALADAVQEVLELEKGQISPPPRVGSKYNAAFISGMAQVDEHFVMLVDVEKVFSSNEINLLQAQETTEADI